MVILGIDPGIAIVGWGVLSYDNNKFTPLGYGSITTGPESPLEDRLASIYDELDAIIKKYRPDAVSVEELFWNTNQKTGIIVAQARGVILLCIRKNDVPFFEYTPLQVKQSVTGYGRADKKQMITLVTMLLALDEPPKPDDTADALALAITHGHASLSRIAAYYNKASNAGYGRRTALDPRFENATNIVRRAKPRKSAADGGQASCEKDGPDGTAGADKTVVGATKGGPKDVTNVGINGTKTIK